MYPSKTPQILINVEEIDSLEIKGPRGWQPFPKYAKDSITKIVSLGTCRKDGDSFAVFWNGYISLGKGKIISHQPEKPEPKIVYEKCSDCGNMHEKIKMHWDPILGDNQK